MTNTINNVPRELLADLLGNDHDKRIMAERHLLAMLANAPSPAGVDGCKCSMSISMLGDGCRHCQPQEYIDRLGEMLDEERSELSDAQAIIDGLLGEVERSKQFAAGHVLANGRISASLHAVEAERDQQAQRIGELEGLLLRVQVSLSLDDTEWGYSGAEKYKLLADIRAALSDGKDSAS